MYSNKSIQIKNSCKNAVKVIVAILKLFVFVFVFVFFSFCRRQQHIASLILFYLRLGRNTESICQTWKKGVYRWIGSLAKSGGTSSNEWLSLSPRLLWTNCLKNELLFVFLQHLSANINVQADNESRYTIKSIAFIVLYTSNSYVHCFCFSFGVLEKRLCFFGVWW